MTNKKLEKIQNVAVNQTIKLKDGRNLGYADLGNPEAKPLFHFHGFPGSRLEAAIFADRVVQNNIRLIGIDRPGMGLSDFKKDRTILDWPDDVVELANALGIGKFAIEGISGGGPYAAACAYKIPDRLTTCGIISGLGPIDLEVEEEMKSIRRLSFVIRRMPWLFKLIIFFQSRGLKDLEKAERKMRKTIKKFPKPDRKVMEDPNLLPLFIKESAEAFRQGNKGAIYEGKLYAKHWGFSLEKISPKLKVYLWHGEVDEVVPVAMGRGVCKAIPNCEGKFYPNDGHYSTIFKYFDEIVNTLIS